ncbi:hypothetical protein N7540_002573 [Penicillium herquei]|nr:hypothetical protein N7540_002573 [Penicillium herquei]
MTIHLLLPSIAFSTPTNHLQAYRVGSTAPLTNGSHSGSDETRTATNALGNNVGTHRGNQSSNQASNLQNPMYSSSIPSSENNFLGSPPAQEDREHTPPSFVELDSHFQRLSDQLRIAQRAMSNSTRIAAEARYRFINASARMSDHREHPHPNELNRSNPLMGLPSSNDAITLILTRDGPNVQSPAAYTVIAPDGTRYLALPPGSGHMRPPVPGNPAVHRGHNLTAAQNHVAGHTEIPNVGSTGQAPPTAGPNGAPDRGGHDNIVALPRNAAQQVLINQPRPRVQAVEGDAGGALRRIWLFIRLYFFIYMITEPGTWTRTLFVTMAVVVALASSSDITRQVYRMMVGPIQRHIERLALAGGPGEQPVAATAENGNNQPAPDQNAPDDIWQYLWRAERSLVLLLASLIPGIGERQVQARNAAEAEAERQRQERERERERQQQQEEVPAPDGDRAQT